MSRWLSLELRKNCCWLTLAVACAGQSPDRRPPARPAATPIVSTPSAMPIKPPGPRQVSALQLPDIHRFKLSNGLRVLLLRDAVLPLISVELMFRSGTIDDPPDRVGLAEFTAMMLRYGVRGLTADQISERVDQMGISLDASSGYELSSIDCSGRAATLTECLTLVSKLARWPTFPRREMQLIADKLAGEVKSERDDPGTLARRHFENMLYGDDHPAGRPMTLASIQRIKRQDLLGFHRRAYAPRRAILVISGDIDPAALKGRLTRLFGSWQGQKVAAFEPPAVKNPQRLRILLIDKPDLTQSFFTLGHTGIRIADPRRDAVLAMNYTLGGGGFSSRLMKTVRSKGGKTYGISSRFASATHDGAFYISTFTRLKETVATLTLVQQELQRFRTSPPSADELAAAKGKIAGGYAIRFQTGGQLASAIAAAELRGLPKTHVSELPLRVQGLDLADLKRAAIRCLHPQQLAVAIVTKAATVAPLLRKAGLEFETISYEDAISARQRAAKN